jgi:hypothetical protein
LRFEISNLKLPRTHPFSSRSAFGKAPFDLGESKKFSLASGNLGETFFENCFAPMWGSGLFLAAQLFDFQRSNHAMKVPLQE